MNKIVNKFFLARNKFMPELHLSKSGFIFNACGPLIGHRERNSLVRETGPEAGAGMHEGLQSSTQYLTQTPVFMRNSPLRERCSFSFLGVFCWYWRNFYFGGRTRGWAIILGIVRFS